MSVSYNDEPNNMGYHGATPLLVSALLFLIMVPSRSVADSTSLNSGRPQCRRGPGVMITSAETFANESLLDIKRGVMYPNGKWYMMKYTYMGCLCELPGKCLRKCCPQKHSYKYGQDKGCIESDNDFNSIVASDGVYGNNADAQVDHLLFIERNPCKGEDYRLRPDYYHDNAYSVLSDGSLSLPKSYVKKLGPDSYCFESDAGSKNKARPYVCLERIGAGEASFTTGLPIWRIAPMVFLAYSILLSLTVGGSEDPPLGKINGCCMLTNLLVGRAVYAIVTALSTQETHMDCLLLALIVQFFLLGSAFWFNIMCLDAFLMTRDSKSPCLDIAATGFAINMRLEKRNMILRGIFAVLWPLLIVTSSGLTTTFSQISRNGINPKASLTQDWIRANSIVHGCLLGSDTILLSCNLVLCLATAAAVIKANISYLTISKELRMSVAKERLITCVGLLLIIAANRAAEGYVWMFPRAAERLDIVDCANGIQDIIISLILSRSDMIYSFEAFKLWMRRRLSSESDQEPLHVPANFTLWLLGCKPTVASPELSNAPRIHA